MEYYVYKYVENDKIIYIGQTTDLEKRIYNHTKDKLANFKGQIYYFKCPNKTAMNSWEYCLINKYHPKYNIALNNSNTSINIEEPQWILYKTTVKPNNLLYFPIKKSTIASKKITLPLEKPVLKFRCSKCRIYYTSSNWYETKKGYAAHCPECYCARWISKSQAKSQMT